MVEWSSLVQSNITTGAVAATAAIVATIVFLLVRKQKKFELVGKVSALNCYPIKSCAGITNDEAFCSTSGIRLFDVTDRHFVIVRPNGDFVTQCQIPRLAGIKTSIDGEELVLNAENMPEIRVPLYPKLDKTKVVPCRVWETRMEAQDCGQEVAQWIGDYVREDLRLLVFVHGLKMRQSPVPNANSKDKVAFPNKGPYHIATEESLADLQSRIGASRDGPITMKNFRPTIVINGIKQAWDEDNWSYLKIGNKVQMRVLALTERCILTTNNPGKYERRSDQEPLKTLRSFRVFPQIHKAPLFGIITGVDAEDTIRVGDPVYAVRK